MLSVQDIKNDELTRIIQTSMIEYEKKIIINKQTTSTGLKGS